MSATASSPEQMSATVSTKAATLSRAAACAAGVSLTISGAGQLVTGQVLLAGQEIAISIDWPANFWNGQPQQVQVAGKPVTVTLQKIRDLP